MNLKICIQLSFFLTSLYSSLKVMIMDVFSAYFWPASKYI